MRTLHIGFDLAVSGLVIHMMEITEVAKLHLEYSRLEMAHITLKQLMERTEGTDKAHIEQTMRIIQARVAEIDYIFETEEVEAPEVDQDEGQVL